MSITLLYTPKTNKKKDLKKIVQNLASGEPNPWNSRFSDSDYTVLSIQSNRLDIPC